MKNLIFPVMIIICLAFYSCEKCKECNIEEINSITNTSVVTKDEMCGDEIKEGTYDAPEGRLIFTCD
jgi:hypothetical protein